MQPSPTPGKRRAPAAAEKMPAWLHWLFSAGLAAALALVLAVETGSLNLPGPAGGPESLLMVLATIGTLAALARQLPLQNVLLATFIIALLGGAVHTLGVMTEIPFGPFLYGEEAGPQLFKTLPWAIPLLWVVTVLNSRGVARLILRPWRKVRTYGFWLIGLTAALTLLFDLALDPFASRVKHYWLWAPTKFPLTWQGAPLVNFLSWAVMTLLMLALVTPVLVKKHPVRRGPDFYPLGLWLGALLLFGIVSATHGLWPAAGLDGVAAGLAAGFAIRGGRW